VDREALLAEIRAHAVTSDRASAAGAIADAIKRTGGYRWVGLYDVTASEVAVVSWSGGGPPAQPRFPVTQGPTSSAVATGEPVVAGSRAVAPVLAGPNRGVRGTIDVESAEADAFGGDGVALLAACADAAAALWAAPTDDLGSLALPAGLPEPVDDGACVHLEGQAFPPLALASSQGPVDLGELAAERLVLYVYPRTGAPDRPVPEGWDEVPGARGCTPQSCAFRDHAAELAALGARVAGLSAQTLDEQVEFAARNHMPFPVVADPERALGQALGLPTFEFAGATLYKRVTLVAERGTIAKVFYPVFPSARNPDDVLAWLRAR
jgi:peroxiredoxin/putative methionine-R-sulfoxide reductase with GAF domain